MKMLVFIILFAGFFYLWGTMISEIIYEQKGGKKHEDEKDNK